MKRLIDLIIVIFIAIGAFAQSSSIVDNGTYITFNFDYGDTISVGKQNIVSVKDQGRDVVIMTSQRWSTDKITRIVTLEYDNFGFSTAGSLRDYLAQIAFRAYKEVYSYEEGNLDTVSYYYGTSLQYQVVYKYTGGLVTSKEIIIP